MAYRSRDLSSRVSAGNDIIDSRDVIERINELESELSGVKCPTCDGADSIEEGEEATAACETCEGSGEVDLSVADPDADVALAAGLNEEVEELEALRDFLEDIEQSAGESAKYGVACIADHYFEQYAQEEAEQCCDMKNAQQWPFNCIDWTQAAEMLQQDYSSFEYGGTTYWVRS